MNVNVPLCVGIIGCGAISDMHINAWRNAGTSVIALCDKNISLAKIKAKKYGIPKYYEDINKMVEKEKLDVVSICTPPNVRLSVIKPVIENGVHVVIEKPFAMSIQEAEEMVKLKNKYGIKLTVVHNWLFSHIMKRVMKSLGEIGDLIGLEIIMLHTKDDPMAADSSHWCHSILAGRFGENLPHPLYIARAFMGDMKIKNIFGSKLGHYPWMPIDELRVLLKDREGRFASIYISFNAPRLETILKVFGTKEILDANLSNNILIKRKYREIKVTHVVVDNFKFILDIINSSFSIASAIITKKYQGMHTEFMKAFVNSLRRDINPPVTAEEALEVVRLHADLCSMIHKSYFSKI